MNPFRFIVRTMLSLAVGVSFALSQVDRFEETWRWVHFTVESGLPSNHVTAMTETEDGTVWVATTAGVAWFDGYQWIQVPGIPVQRYGPPHRFGPGKVVFNAEGRIFAATRDSVVMLPLTNVGMGAPFDDSSLVMKMDNSLFLFKNQNLSLMHGMTDGIKGKIDIFWKTQGGAFWIAALSGVYKWKHDRWENRFHSIPTVPNVTMITENSRGDGLASVLLPLELRGLWTWTADGMPTRDVREMGYDIKSMDVGPNGDAVIIYNSGDVHIRRKGVWSALPVVQTKLTDVEFVRWRDNGDLWFGTERGLYLFKQSSSRWTFLSHSSPNSRNSINEILRSRSGELWLGTADGVDVYEQDGTLRQSSRVGRTPLFAITGLAEDDEGGIWISSGAAFNGAYRWWQGSWEYHPISDAPGGARIHKIRKDHHGRLWFLTLSKLYGYRDSEELGTYTLSDGKLIHWGTDQGLVNGRVYSFASRPNGELWFGTLGGISRWRPSHNTPGPALTSDPKSDGSWTHWTVNEGLHYNKVFTIAIDKQERVWFGHSNTGGGLGFVDERDSIHYITVADGLLNNNVWDLSVDSTGMLWITTDGGLCSYSNGVWLTFDERTGLNFPRLWPVLPLGDRIYVGTRGRGVAILDRSESASHYPRLIIERPLVEDRAVHLRWKALAYWGEILPGEILTRYRVGDGPWSAWNTTRELTGIRYQPGDFTLQVQAKGLLGDYDASGQTATFSVLPPLALRPLFYLPVGALALGIIFLGTVLLVRKRKHDAELRKSEAKFRAVAEMTPSAIFIYQRGNLLFANPGAEALTEYTGDELRSMRLPDLIHPEFRAMMVERENARTGETIVPNRAEFKIVTKQGRARWVDYRWGWIRFQGMPATLGTAFDITERKDAEEQLRLLTSELTLTEERERHRMATYLHDVIGQTLALCRMKIRKLQKSIVSNETEEQLKEIQDLVDQSINNTQSLTFELCPPILYELNFDAAVGWLVERFQQQHGLHIVLRTDDQAKQLTEEMRTILFQALREVLVNVSKHARAKSVEVVLSCTGSEIRIIVADDGVGFDPTLLKPDGKREGGFGLFNIRERLRYLGGSLDVSSSPGRGTCVSISAPLRMNEPRPAGHHVFRP